MSDCSYIVPLYAGQEVGYAMSEGKTGPGRTSGAELVRKVLAGGRRGESVKAGRRRGESVKAGRRRGWRGESVKAGRRRDWRGESVKTGRRRGESVWLVG